MSWKIAVLKPSPTGYGSIQGSRIISRDRSKDYQRGATDGAPAAQQVIDRWHVLKNLREAVERLLNRTQKQQDAQATQQLRAIHEQAAN